MEWLQASRWHSCFRLPYDVLLHGTSKYPRLVGSPPLGEARLYRQVRLWADGVYRCHLVLAIVQGAKDSWAVVTDEPPSLKTLWQYALRFQVEELFLHSRSGAFELEDSRLRCQTALERLYLVAALALLHATTQGMSVQVLACINRLTLTGGAASATSRWVCVSFRVLCIKGGNSCARLRILPQDPQPCFASNWAERDFL